MGKSFGTNLINSSDDFVVFDTETTGLDSTAEICSISFVDFYGNKLFSEMVKPISPIPENVTRIHGITNEMVKDCKSIRYYWDFICNQFINKKIVCGYNVMYDIRLLLQSAAIQDPLLTNTRSFSPLMILDIMQLACSSLDMNKFVKLRELAKILEIEDPEQYQKYHGSLYDATVTAACLRELVTL